MDKEDSLGYLFSKSSKHYKRAVNQMLEKYDLTLTQCGVIRILLHSGELTQAEIANVYSADKSTIGSVIEKLREKEFVDKKISQKDKRAYAVSITPKAKNIIEEIDQLSEDMAIRALEGLSQEEIQHFYKALDTIIRNLS